MKKIKIFRSALIAVVFLAFVFLVCPVRAQENSNVQQKDLNLTTVATVNVYRTTIVKQEGNDITLAFDLSNREKVQPGVRYSIQLLKTEGENQTVVDEKIYDEVLNLGEKETIHREIKYSAPAYLKGDFQVAVISQNEKGLPFGYGIAKDQVALNGSGEMVSIDSNNCYFTIQGEKNNPHYVLSQGVDVAKTENLILNCKIKNSFKIDQSVTPVFNTYYRTSFGKLISTNKGENFTLKAGEEKDVVIAITKPDEAQAYNAVLELSNTQNQIVSNKITLHYIVQGASATIQNLTLDKDYYQKGDSAKISFFWSASADSFPGSRAQANGKERGNLSVTIKNSQGVLCSEPITKEINSDSQVPDVSLEIPINVECLNPSLAISIKDNNGNVLDEGVINLTSKNVPGVSPPAGNKKVTKAQVMTVVSILIILLIIIIISYYFKRKKEDTLLKTLFLLLILGTGMMFLGAKEAKADTYREPQAQVYFSFGLDSDTYAPNSTITAYGQARYTDCDNAWTCTNIKATVNGSQKTLLNCVNLGLGNTNKWSTLKTATFTAQPSTGNYNAVFRLASIVHFETYDVQVGPADVDVPYAIVAPINGQCGEANGQSYSVTPTGNGCGNDQVPRLCLYPAVISSCPSGSGPWAWTCPGSNGGTNASCSASVAATPVNGQCGPAATTYDSSAASFSGAFCNSGMVTPANPIFPSAGSTVSWQCLGSNGGTNASCSASRNSAVLPSPTVTLTASPNPVFPGKATSLTWKTSNVVSCKATSTNNDTSWTGYIPPSDNGSTKTSNPLYADTTFTIECSSGTGVSTGPQSVVVRVTSSPINGQCGSPDGQTLTSAPAMVSCVSGTPSAVSGTGPWNWTCYGSGGGTNASCSANICVPNYSYSCYYTGGTCSGQPCGSTVTRQAHCARVDGNYCVSTSEVGLSSCSSCSNQTVNCSACENQIPWKEVAP